MTLWFELEVEDQAEDTLTGDELGRCLAENGRIIASDLQELWSGHARFISCRVLRGVATASPVIGPGGGRIDIKPL